MNIAIVGTSGTVGQEFIHRFPTFGLKPVDS